MDKLQTDTRMTLLSRIPVMLLSFIAIVLLTRLLGPTGNGIYTFLYAALQLFFIVFGLQLDNSLTFFLSGSRYEFAKVFTATGVIALATTLVFAVFLSIVVFFIPGGSLLFIPEGQPVEFFFWFLLAAFLLRFVHHLVTAALKGLFMFKTFNLLLILAQFIPVIIYGIIFWMSTYRMLNVQLLFYFKVILAIDLLLALTGVSILMIKGRLRFSGYDNSLRKTILGYSAKNLLNATGHYLNKRLDVWFVQYIKGTTALGHYGLATQISNFISEALTPFNQVLLPYLSGTDPENHPQMVGRIARLNFFISSVAAIIIMATSWFFIPLLFSNRFADAVPAAQILAIGIIFISQRLVFTTYFRAIDQIRHAVIASWTGVAVTVILDLLLIPLWGITGASIATVIAYGVSSGILVTRALGLLQLTFNDIFLVRPGDIRWLFSAGRRHH